LTATAIGPEPVVTVATAVCARSDALLRIRRRTWNVPYLKASILFMRVRMTSLCYVNKRKALGKWLTQPKISSGTAPNLEFDNPGRIQIPVFLA
jgi:hypothetical protein